MLPSIIICPDPNLRGQFLSALAEVGGVAVARSIDQYPDEWALVGILRSSSAQMVILSLESPDQAVAIAAKIEESAPGTQLMAISGDTGTGSLMCAIRSGIREFHAAPFSVADIEASLNRIKDALVKRPPQMKASDRLLAFFPAKAGSGASTLAANLSHALAEKAGGKVLLADLDLFSGIAGFLLNLNQLDRSIMHALECAEQMDQSMWRAIVGRRGPLDVLVSPSLEPGLHIEPVHVRRMLDYARTQYDTVCADLSGGFEPHSVEILLQARRVFLVTTSDLPALRLTREKLKLLRGLDLSQRISLVLNRRDRKSELSVSEIEETLGMRADVTLPNDYASIRKSLLDGTPLDHNSPLGIVVRELADQLFADADAPPRNAEKMAAIGQKALPFLDASQLRALRNARSRHAVLGLR